jgi:hypothetical protein
VTAPTKPCSVCKKEKPLTPEFYTRDRSQKSGFKPSCKTCYNQKQILWREKYRPRMRVYKEENRERIAEQNQAYREQNRELIRERNRARYKGLSESGKLDRTKRMEQTRAWRNRNPDHQREYYERNREAYFVRTHIRLARKSNRPDNFTPADWQFALDYFNGCCAACGRPPGLWHTLARDHWIPLTDANCPGTVPSNMVPLCHGIEGCNNSKHDFPAEQWVITTFGKRKGAAILLRIAEFFSHVRQVP